MSRAVRGADPRSFQIAFLATLLGFVLLQREASSEGEQVASLSTGSWNRIEGWLREFGDLRDSGLVNVS